MLFCDNVMGKCFRFRALDKERFEDNSEIILFLDENICCDNSLEPSRRESFYN